MSSNKPVFNFSRRELLKQATILAPATCLSASGFALGTETKDQKGIVAGIDPKNVVDAYHARELDGITDAELYRQVTQLVATPRRRGTSFSIHAPLEVMARYGLLPLVVRKQRSTARLQLVATAAMYGNDLEPTTPEKTTRRFASLAAAEKQIARALEKRDESWLESTVLQVASQFGTASLVQTLTPLALPTMTGASHSHIGLWLLLRHGGAVGSGDAALLRTAVRALAQNPQQRLTSFGGMTLDGKKPLKRTAIEIEKEILTKLSRPAKVVASSRSMMGQLTATEEAGRVNEMFGELMQYELTNEQIDAAFRAVMRVSAHSMLQDDLGQAKFGWSHGLTMPQAAFGLSSFNINRKLALASTLVWITSRRCISGSVPLDFDWEPKKPALSTTLQEALHTSPHAAAARVWHAERFERPQIIQTLATEASIRNDQHLVKYVRACLDLTTFDPLHERLYLSAAAHICGLWIGERPEDRIYDNLPIRRDVRS